MEKCNQYLFFFFVENIIFPFLNSHTISSLLYHYFSFSTSFFFFFFLFFHSALSITFTSHLSHLFFIFILPPLSNLFTLLLLLLLLLFLFIYTHHFLTFSVSPPLFFSTRHQQNQLFIWLEINMIVLP